ncbi:MAG: winged helix family transcriptional regulator, partial [Caldilineae bacterium]
LTNFPSYQTVRDVLGVSFDGMPSAVEYLSKEEGAEAMLETVARAFSWHVRVNWNLRICWNTTPPLSFLHLASTLQPDLTGEIWIQRAAELETLFRRLFRAYQEIWVGQIFWHTQQRLCLPVLARSPEGVTDNRLLVCDARGELLEEVARVRKLAPKTIAGVRPVEETATVHFEAALYQTPHLSMESMQSWRKFFEVNKERSLKAALNHLLTESLAVWHQHGEMLETTHDLMTLYRRQAGLETPDLTRETVKHRIDRLVQSAYFLSDLEIETTDSEMTFRVRGHEAVTCPHPAEALYTALVDVGQPVVCRVSPGRLTADNLLVDAQCHLWPTDFAKAGQTPQWWDFVCLEAILRFDLSTTTYSMDWYTFESCLVKPHKLHERLRKRDVLPALRTNITLIEQVRKQASKETSPNVLPYYAGLLVWVVAAIVEYNIQLPPTPTERMRAVHLLLAAAMLAQRLQENIVSSPERRGGTLRLDEEGQVFIGESRLTDALTRQEHRLLQCLYQQPGQTVSRQTIVKEVFEEAYRQEDEQLQSRINALVRRVRQKIEPDPTHPRYLVTVKGRGYRLHLDGNG